MDWKVVLEFVRPELTILVVFIWTLGLFLKKAPWFEADWQIPFILLFVSVVFTNLYIVAVLGEGFSLNIIVSSTVQGVIIAALAVFSNEALKQLFIKREEDRRTYGKF